ncbi:Hypothetical predicted protein [Lecanosticta acicola]|uniref:Uncharacterized protein n=1 Tax=Lecanosticta acicola TaxID=111012 RepID=A0AAI9EE39_9PEZI|nr:Hypothetical predicted protein [Lecanosticta acicola]
MANRSPYVAPQGSSRFLQQKKLSNGSPKLAPQSKNEMNNMHEAANGTRTGDAVSDDSGNETAQSDGNANEEQDSDEEDGFALPGARITGSSVPSRLAGLVPNDVDMLDDEQDATAGAEDEDDEDDEVYGDVEDISDGDSSDVEEDGLLRLAADDLRKEYERLEEPSRAMTSEISNMSLAADQEDRTPRGDDLDFGLDFSADPFGGLQQHDQLYQEMLADATNGFFADATDPFGADDALSSWREADTGIGGDEAAVTTVTQKKVRFEETASSRASSVSSDDDPREEYPDLFADYDDPASRQRTHSSSMNFDVIHDADSEYEHYEFDDDDERVAFEIDAQDDSDTDMSDDSDDGETTDEESPEDQIARVNAIKAQRAKMIMPPPPSKSAPTTPVASKRSSPAPSRSHTTTSRVGTAKGGRGPRMGTFAHDPTRAFVTAAVGGSGIRVTCPTKPPEKDRAYWERARQALNSRDGSPSDSVSWTRSTPQLPNQPKRPFTARSTLGTMFDGNLDFLRNNDENGIVPKRFLVAARNDSMQSSMTSTTMTGEDESEDESTVNMTEFLQIEESSDDDEAPSAGILSPSKDFFGDAIFESSPMASHEHGNGLLSHFDQQPGLISSFRNNQNHARHVSSLAANPAKRAQTSEANALQKGRRSAANTPITPARKKRVSQDLDLTGAGIKKNASPLVQKQRRRSRGNSLSGIHQTLTRDRFAGNTN